jgi:acetylornithine deacetylase/succinyl-diaminopimelate desuccinylase-like protein
MTKIELEKTFEDNRDRYIREWSEFLAFPSVSADPDHAADCNQCAQWLADHLTTLGFATRLVPTASHPVVMAERPGKPGAPTVLFYGHYDVQPADPLDLWISPPFKPTLRQDRLYARGAQDNKGQVFAALKAIETLVRANQLDATLKVLIEGDEETGQMPILKVLNREKAALKADIVMAADTGTVSSGAPTLTMGLRGIIHLTAVLTGPGHDLHSGVHGGRSPNPANGMARLTASLHDASGRVAVPGFYDGVQEPSQAERALANAEPLDIARYESLTGVQPLGGEQGYSPIDRTAFRPAIDLNGIHSGYGGAGSKTIIPARAEAKISARLVPGQQPDRILEAIITHLRRNVPAGLRLEITEQGIGGPAVRVDLDSPAVLLARQVLSELSHQPLAFLWEGASVPILSYLPAIAGGQALLVGFGSEEDNIHAPNESYSIAQFRKGYLYTGLLLGRMKQSVNRSITQS